MIQPKIVDSVSDEEGYYWCKMQSGSKTVWKMLAVGSLNSDGPNSLIAKGLSFNQITILENEFDQYTWSEKIGEPVENNFRDEGVE